MASDGRLEGKITAVTGASSGSGRAIARKFADEGATVVMLARGKERLAELEATMGGSAVGIPTDIGDPGLDWTGLVPAGADVSVLVAGEYDSMVRWPNKDGT